MTTKVHKSYGRLLAGHLIISLSAAINAAFI